MGHYHKVKKPSKYRERVTYTTRGGEVITDYYIIKRKKWTGDKVNREVERMLKPSRAALINGRIQK